LIGLSTESIENLVATGVDMLSISVAYQLGISQSGFLIGALYAILDAYVVIWQRQRLTRFAHTIVARLSRLLSNTLKSWKIQQEIVTEL
jgi:hypothetical protein